MVTGSPSSHAMMKKFPDPEGMVAVDVIEYEFGDW
jgi:hypothetical protein